MYQLLQGIVIEIYEYDIIKRMLFEEVLEQINETIQDLELNEEYDNFVEFFFNHYEDIYGGTVKRR